MEYYRARRMTLSCGPEVDPYNAPSLTGGTPEGERSPGDFAVV
jgi:hypothetical protein